MKYANTCRTTITNQALFTTSPHHPQQHLATADSEASNIYVAKQDMQMLTPDAPVNITHVQAAEGTIMKSHATGDIVFKGMPNVTFKAQVFIDLNEHVSKPTLSHGLSVRPLPMDSVADLIE